MAESPSQCQNLSPSLLWAKPIIAKIKPLNIKTNEEKYVGRLASRLKSKSLISNLVTLLSIPSVLNLKYTAKRFPNKRNNIVISKMRKILDFFSSNFIKKKMINKGK